MIYEIKIAWKVFRKEGVHSFFTKLRAYLKDLWNGFVFMATPLPQRKTVRDVVDFGPSAFGGLIGASQVKSEIFQLGQLVAERKPRVVVEIGTANGGTLFIWHQLAHPDALITSIDLPGGVHGGGYPFWKSFIYKKFCIQNQQLHLIRGDSQSPKTRLNLEKILKGKKIDFLFIDGEHTYKGVKADFLNYAELVSPGGIIAFHDICVHPPALNCSVDLFWNEIKFQYRSLEFIENPSQGWGGIGVLFV